MRRARPSTRCRKPRPTRKPRGSPKTENRADVIGGIDLSDEPSDVADILIDLTQRETKTFSGSFAAALIVGELKRVARMHKKPLKSAGFRVLKAHGRSLGAGRTRLRDSNKDDLKHLVSDSWRTADRRHRWRRPSTRFLPSGLSQPARSIDGN